MSTVRKSRRAAREYTTVLRHWTAQASRSRFQQSTLRQSWIIIQPIAFVALYAAFFSGVLAVKGDGLPYLTFFVAGAIVFRFVAQALGSTSLIYESGALLKTVYFRREIIPISSALLGFADLGIGLIALAAIGTWQGYPPQWTSIAVVIPIAIVAIDTVAALIILSTVAVFFRDLAVAMPFVVQGLFFASAIAYPPSQLPSGIVWLTWFNPLTIAAEGVRDSVLRGVWPVQPHVLAHLIFAPLFLIGSIAYLRSIEHRISDVA